MRRMSTWVLCGWLVACGGQAPTRLGGTPSWREGGDGGLETVPPAVGAPSRVEFAPTDPGVDRYAGSATPAPSEPVADAIARAASEVAGELAVPVPVPDGRLAAATRELAAVVPDSGVLPYALVEFALLRHGIVEPSPHLIVMWGDLTDPRGLVAQLRPKLGEMLAGAAPRRLGVGVHRARPDSGEGVVVFALQASYVTLAPMPRQLPARGVLTLDGAIAAGFASPEVFVTGDDGAVVAVPTQAGRGGAVRAEVRCPATPGRLQVELTAADVQGAQVLANFPVYCGIAPPTSLAIDLASDPPVQDAAEAERRLLAMANDERVRHGLAPVAWADDVAAVARAHSHDMVQSGFVAHVSPTTGDAGDRIERAGVYTTAVMENVARAYGVGEAHAGLMNSPGHRANILSVEATHVGMGVVLGEVANGRREVFVTQLFTRVPPPLVPSVAAATLHDKLRAAGRPVANSTALASIAQATADRLAAGGSQAEAWAAAQTRLRGLPGSYRRVGSVITAISDYRAMTAQELLAGYAPQELGIGVAEGPHPEIGPRAAWVVILLAER